MAKPKDIDPINRCYRKGYVDGVHDNEQPKLSKFACSIRHRTFYFLGFSKSPNPKVQQMLGEKSLKGGDPAAGSPTATLLRLHPSL
jgi:hypothetical protein